MTHVHFLAHPHPDYAAPRSVSGSHLGLTTGLPLELEWMEMGLVGWEHRWEAQ